MTIQDPIVVVGAGLMGTGIAHGFIASGHAVTLVDNQPAALERAKTGIGKILADGVRLGKSTEADASAAMARLHRLKIGAQVPWEAHITDSEVREEFAFWVQHWRRRKAPPFHDRPVGVQEVETIFCKWKSHVKGHYPLGKDTRELHHGLQGWGALAEKLRKVLPHHA